MLIKLRDHVIPPVLVMITIALQIISYLVEFPTIRKVLGIVSIIGGFAFAFISLQTLRLGGTTYKQALKPTKLITTGVYKYTRNPVYLGMVIILSGVAILTNTLCATMATLFFYYVIDAYYIPSEESICKEIFKEEFTVYAEKTPRWI